MEKYNFGALDLALGPRPLQRKKDKNAKHRFSFFVFFEMRMTCQNFKTRKFVLAQIVLGYSDEKVVTGGQTNKENRFIIPKKRYSILLGAGEN